MSRVFLINGPNLNMLGKRPTEHYGSQTIDEIIKSVVAHGSNFKIEIEAVQSNSEGTLIDAIQKAGKSGQGIIINPGGYSHTSIALRDALECVSVPIIEVHISNIFSREQYRRHSYVSEVANGVISGLGAKGYILAVDAIAELITP